MIRLMACLLSFYPPSLSPPTNEHKLIFPVQNETQEIPPLPLMVLRPVIAALKSFSKAVKKKNWNCKQFRNPETKLLYDLRGLGRNENMKGEFSDCLNLLNSNLSTESINKTDESRRVERHINTTQIILIKIIWGTFFSRGAFFSGRVDLVLGYVLGKTEKLRIPFSESGVIESFLFHHIHSELFSLKDLNARHFIWPEFSLSLLLTPLCLEKSFYYIQIAYTTLLFLFLTIVQVLFVEEIPRIPPIIQPKISNEMHRKKGFRSQKNISFRQHQHVKTISCRPVGCKNDRHQKIETEREKKCESGSSTIEVSS